MVNLKDKEVKMEVDESATVNEAEVNGNDTTEKAEKVVSSSQMDRKFMSYFWDLSSNNPPKRQGAVQKIVDFVSEKQKAHEGEGMCDELSYSVSRLVQGLASDRKSSRWGFSTTLTKLLMDHVQVSTGKITMLMEEKLKVKSKNEGKDLYIGQVFCLLALLRSGRLNSDNDVLDFTIKRLLKLADTKSYLKGITFHALQHIVKQVSEEQFEKVVWPPLKPTFSKGWSNATADIIETLEACHHSHPHVCSRDFLQAKKWISAKAKISNLVASHNFKHLGEIIAETTQHHPTISHFALNTVERVASTSKGLGELWEKALTPALLRSSPERKFLAIKLALHSLRFLDGAEQLGRCWSAELLGVVRGAQERSSPLHLYVEGGKGGLGAEVGEAVARMSPDNQLHFLMQLLSGPANTKWWNHNVVHNAVVSLKYEALIKYVDWLKHFFITGAPRNSQQITLADEVKVEICRRWCAQQLCKLVRTSALPRYECWVTPLVEFIAFHSLFTFTHDNNKAQVCGVRASDMRAGGVSDQMTSELRKSFRNLVSHLNSMTSLPVDERQRKEDEQQQKSAASSSVTSSSSMMGVMRSSGKFWLHRVVTFIDRTIKLEGVSLRVAQQQDDDEASSWEGEEAWRDCMAEIERTDKFAADTDKVKESKRVEARALQLLLLNTALQLLLQDDEDDAGEGEDEGKQACVLLIADVKTIIAKRFCADDDKKKKKKKKKQQDEDNDDEPDWVEVVVEILLNMLSSGSRGNRVVVDHVFKMIMSHMTAPAIQIILDVLNAKEGDADVDDEEEDEDMMESDSKTEQKEDEEDDSDDDESDDDDDDDDAQGEEDEEFRKKIKQALGDAAVKSDEEDDDDDEDEEKDEQEEEEVEMSDEAMMKIDHLIAAVFKERKKSRSKGKEKMEKVEMAHFKLRCLNLLESFVARRHADSSLVFALIFPLIQLIETSSKVAEEAELAEKASVLLRLKICKMKTFARDLDAEECSRLHDLLERLADKSTRLTRGGNSAFISRVTSQCCLFVVRVLIGNGKLDPRRLEGAYASRLSDFMTRRESRVDACAFSELIHARPALSAFLAPALLSAVADACVPHRRRQACLMLSQLVPHHPHLCAKTTDRVCEVLSGGDDKDEPLKHHAQLLKLVDAAVSVDKKAPPSDEHRRDGVERERIAEVLLATLERPHVARSQELTNLTWKVLTALGRKRPQVDKKGGNNNNNNKQQQQQTSSAAPPTPDNSSKEKKNKKKNKRKSKDSGKKQQE